MLISKPSLDLIKQEVLSDLKSLVLKIDLDRLSIYNKGYLSYKKDPYKMFVLNELTNWNKIIDFYNFRRGVDCKGILDIGTFIPFYPVVLKKIGYKVEVVEKVSLYGKSFDPILEYLIKQNIKIYNIDIIKDPINSLPKGFDILLIAILEHLNGSPKSLIDKIKLLIVKNSLLYIHVPNICKLSNVINILRGKSLLPSYENYYFSSYPFEGHNREMTLEELLLLCKYSSLEVVEKGCA
ncbi:hypothetical protein CVT91_02165 [Candidatus Atribacteria bacterium HGW-Atribacteria-1]|nr:MAG: hypothetical protein CVT91_02165 [Candidatus Atribacteria bacterium HGW-Atribacteria-1]